MVIPFGRTLFGLFAALVVSSIASAQDAEFEEAVKLLRMGQNDEALEKLREVVQLDPTNEDALRLYRNTDQDIWYMLVLHEGEIGQIAQSLLERAKMQRRELSRDEATMRGSDQVSPPSRVTVCNTFSGDRSRPSGPRWYMPR